MRFHLVTYIHLAADLFSALVLGALAVQRRSQHQQSHDLRQARSKPFSTDFTFELQYELECRILAITDEPANN